MSTIEISALYTYPIKSCAGLSHDTRTLDKRGLAYDRHWMIVTPAQGTGLFLTGRENPKMALVQPSFEGNELVISIPNHGSMRVPLVQDVSKMPVEVVVWDDVCQAIDEGNAVAEWLSDFLGQKVRLVAMADRFTRVIDTEYTTTPTQTAFGDGYPLLLISEASLNDLNTRLVTRGKNRVEMKAFRPNAVVKGCEAFAEDTWKHVLLGDVPFDVVKPCKRCAMTTIDWNTGTIPDAKEPTATLADYRRYNGGVIFGQNIVHRGTGELQVGQIVTILE
jgi:uncharacterized protein YcbX